MCEQLGMPVLLDALSLGPASTGCATGGAIGWTPWSWRLLQLVCGESLLLVARAEAASGCCGADVWGM